MKGNSIYICHTYFQVYITLIKAMIDKQKNDVVICNTIPNSKRLINSIKKSKIFKNVYYYSEVEALQEFMDRKIERKIFRTDQTIKLFEKNANFRLDCYDDIYVYNDWTTVGAYLIDKKLKYHLIEDGINAFYYIKGNFAGKVTFLNPNMKYRVKKIIKRILHIGYDFFGQSKYVIDIEVNDKSKIFIKNKNVKEVPRKQLCNEINNDEKLIIYNIFMDNDLDLSSSKKKILILTQPLFIDKMVSSMNEQLKIYTDIINKYIKKYDVYIKPHPRDTFDYKKINSKVNIIDKDIPIEILNYNNNIKFEKAITITSSSIEMLDFIDEKIVLGFEFLDKIGGKYESSRNSSNKIK